jgi:hypothetical protein
MLPGGAALGQSLGELAEDAKRKRKKATKVYTDEDLKQRAPAASPSPGASTSRGSGAARGESGGDFGSEGGGREGGGREGGEGGPAGGDRGDEAYWRSQVESRLGAIRAAQQQVEAIQNRLNALNSDLLPGGAADPFRQETLEAEKAKARQELEEAKLQLERAEDAFQELEEEARRKGVPPGWVREP